MKILNLVIFSLFTVFLVSGCRKSALKEPTDVVFTVDINKEAMLNNNLQFTDGQILIRSLTFDGIRIKGDDVYFEQEFEGGLVTPFSVTNLNPKLKFDIPQGSYSSIRIDFESEKSDFEKISVNGSYNNSSNEVLPVRVEIERIEFYDKIAKNKEGSTNIDLVAGTTSKVVIQLNPVFWFSTISINQLDNAFVTDINGVNTILISQDVNEDIYDVIEDKVGSDINITFD